MASVTREQSPVFEPFKHKAIDQKRRISLEELNDVKYKLGLEFRQLEQLYGKDSVKVLTGHADCTCVRKDYQDCLEFSELSDTVPPIILPTAETVMQQQLDETIPPMLMHVHTPDVSKGAVKLSKPESVKYHKVNMHVPSTAQLNLNTRKKKDRKQMYGYACRCCRDYYDNLGLSPESKRRRIQQISRHRTLGSHTPPETPEHYWAGIIPSTQEMRDKGMLHEEVYVFPTSKDNEGLDII